jgi:hypothetical protein
MARKARTTKSDKPAGEPAYAAVDWQQSSEVGMNYGTYLQIEKHAAPQTPRGAAGDAVPTIASSAGDDPAPKSFRRGRIWA